MRSTRSKVLVSIGIGHVLLLIIWMSFRLTDHDFAHMFQGSPFHIAMGYCLIWPSYVVLSFSPEFVHSRAMLPIIYLMDAIAYSLVGFLILSFISPSRKSTYLDEV